MKCTAICFAVLRLLVIYYLVTRVQARSGTVSHELLCHGMPCYAVDVSCYVVDAHCFETDMRCDVVAQRFCMQDYVTAKQYNDAIC